MLKNHITASDNPQLSEGLLNNIHPLFGSQFRASSHHDGVTIQLSNADVPEGAVFSGAYNANVTFQGYVKRLSFTGSVFVDCTFDLDGDDTSASVLNMQHAVFYGCSFNTKSPVDTCFFNQSRFVNCKIIDLEAMNCDFEGATFEQCSFSNCIFRETIFEGAVFEGCRFDSCQLRNLAFDYATFRENDFTECVFSIRQSLYSFGLENLLNSSGILFSAGSRQKVTGEELRAELPRYIKILYEQGEYHPLINAKIAIGDKDGYEHILQEAFRRWALLGQFRRIELLVNLMNYIPLEAVQDDLRGSLYRSMVDSVWNADERSDVTKMRITGAFESMERIRESLQVRFGEKAIATISIGSGTSADDEARNRRLCDSLVTAFDDAGIKYDLQSSRNSPIIFWLVPMVPLDQIVFLLEMLRDTLPGFASWLTSSPLIDLLTDELLNPAGIARDFAVGLASSYVCNCLSNSKNKSEVSQRLHISVKKPLFHAELNYSKDESTNATPDDDDKC